MKILDFNLQKMNGNFWGQKFWPHQDFIRSKELVQIAVHTNENTKDIAEIKSQMATKEDNVITRYNCDRYYCIPISNAKSISTKKFHKLYK